MAHSEFDKAMKALELYHDLKVPVGTFPILRIDGRTFSKVTQRMQLEKPYDEEFHSWMGAVTKKLVEDLGAIYGYHQSDEISLVFPSTFEGFDREVIKLVSVSAGLASTVFQMCLVDSRLQSADETPHFDSRIVVAANLQTVEDYLVWRQQDATRNCLNSWCHWTAILRDGLDPRQAGKLFEKKDVAFKNDFLFNHGINFNDLPLWQRRGSAYFWETFTKDGFNPKTQQVVEVERRRVTWDDELPKGDEYRAYLKEMFK
jgi:tRNA(His) guanylyltransferase